MTIEPDFDPNPRRSERRLRFAMHRVLALVAIILAALPSLAGAASVAGASDRANVVATSGAMRAEIGPPTTAADGSRLFRIAIRSAGAPLGVDVPADARDADLVVDGTVVRRVGRDVYVASSKLGHASTVLSLAGLGAGHDVVVRVDGSLGTPRLIDVRAIETGYATGAIAGAYVAMLVVVAIFSLVVAVASRDVAGGWFVAFVTTVLACQPVREGFVDPQSPPVGATVLGFVFSSAIALSGFTVTYLQLWSQRRRLAWIAIAGNVAPLVALASGAALARATVPKNVVAVGVEIALLSLVSVAIVRRVEGFRPAAYLLVGLFGLTAVTIFRIGRQIAGVSVPLLDRYGVEIGVTFAVLVFSIGIAYRARYDERAIAAMRRQLAGATHDAHHDALTQLLNRRGLDALMHERGGRGTLLYVDIDRFKAVNDRGGHAAGDAALVEIGRVLRNVVRSTDVVARVGGDEFVVILPDLTDPTMEREIVDRARDAIAAMRPLPLANVRIGASVGSSRYGDGISLADAVAVADLAAYEMKAHRPSAAS